MMKRVFRDHEAMSLAASEWMGAELKARAKSLWCLATGNTPSRTYEQFAAAWAGKKAELAGLNILKLDEWGGLAMDDPATCESYLQRLLIGPLRLGRRYVGFESRPDHPKAECERMSKWLERRGRLDVCVLGLGLNGHLGFNEPAEFLQARAHVATLSPTSMSHAMLEQSRGRPTYGMTLGMGEILGARRILLLVSGEAKQAALKRMLDGRLTTEFPASFLQLHPDVTLYCDRAASPKTGAAND